MASPDAILTAKHLSKQFGGVDALIDADLELRSGETHGLLGQNGSGKSTLIKILAGYHTPASGAELVMNGEAVSLPLRPGQFRELGLSFVHQDLGLAESMTVLDNLRVARFRGGGLRRISWRKERRYARGILARLDLLLDLDTPVRELADVDRALVAIVRAVQDVLEREERGVLVLDEPTVYLPRDSLERLFDVMRTVTASGAGILFVSHQIGEVRTITDRATVLRDGRNVGTVTTSEVSDDQLIQLILGRSLEDLYPAPPEPSEGDDSVLVVRDLVGGNVHGVDFEVRPGETLGLTGLVGMGFEDVPYLVFGARKATGQLTIGGQPHNATRLSPQKSGALGLVLVPANRPRDAVAPGLSLEENVGLPVLDRHFNGLNLRLGRLRADVLGSLTDFEVHPLAPDRLMSTFSGGNQQKAVLAKWLQTNPKVLLLHEPTQGVDVGARKQIFALIRAATAQGTAAVIASSEHEDLGHLCDRVLVFRDGRVAAELSGAQVNPQRILDESYRVSVASHASAPVAVAGANAPEGQS